VVVVLELLDKVTMVALYQETLAVEAVAHLLLELQAVALVVLHLYLEVLSLTLVVEAVAVME
jgi:hypothetical protein